MNKVLSYREISRTITEYVLDNYVCTVYYLMESNDYVHRDGDCVGPSIIETIKAHHRSEKIGRALKLS